MSRGDLTAIELHDILFGAGGGNNEQYDKLLIFKDGAVWDSKTYYPSCETGGYELRWSHTGQVVALDRAMLEQVLVGRFRQSASAAVREVENCERHGSTKTLPKGWSIGSDGETLNQFGEPVN